MDNQVLASQIAVITGADSGIGQATAVEFARNGASVAINYLDDEAGAESTRKQVEDAGGRAIVVRGDIGKPEDVDKLFRDCEERLGTPTILVNNAGIDSTGKPVEELSLAEWQHALQTNVTGAFLCSQRFIKAVKKEQRHGKIINISSVHEEIPRAGAAEYCASKGAMRNLMRCLALELAQSNINVNDIAPGMVLTPMNKEALEDPKKREEQVQSIPMKRAAEPGEVAKVALFLASSASDYVHGSTYTIDGGLMQNLGQGA